MNTNSEEKTEEIKLVDPTLAAKMLSISTRTLRRMVKSGELKAMIMIMGRPKYVVKAIDAFIDSKLQSIGASQTHGVTITG